MKLFMLHNIPPLPPFVCVCWMARIYKNLPEGQKNTKIWTEPSSFKKVIGTQKKPTLDKTTHKSSVDKFLRVLFYILLYDIFPPQIGSICHPKTTQNVFK